ncbi:MAG TPA: 50S ribosomal protein L25/general stress protein Ctc [Actinomycetota bacterium]|jgi:large subunit ribosomal protein L25|nr:50S ribosomal protein L25/general stress protein Ctc [Actinomycetota bacterium]
MAEQKLTAEKREDSGKGVARKLRAAGRVPAVLYGHGMQAMPLSVDAKELFRILHTEAGANVLIDLLIDGQNHLALPREVQRDYVRDRLLHVDFLAVRRDVKVAVDVRVQVVGESPGVKSGGVLEHQLWELHVECFPQDVPDAIEADISALEVGDSLKVADLKVSPDVTVLTAADETVLAVVTPQVRVVEEEVEEEALAEAEGATAEEAAEEAAEVAEPGEAAAEEGGEG